MTAKNGEGELKEDRPSSIASLSPVLPSPGDLKEFLSTLPPYSQVPQDEKKEKAEGEGWRSPLTYTCILRGKSNQLVLVPQPFHCVL